MTYPSIRALIASSRMVFADSAKISVQSARVIRFTDIGPSPKWEAEPVTDLATHPENFVFPYGWYDNSAKVAYPGAAIALHVQNTKSDRLHYVILSAHRQPSGDTAFSLHCGDNFLEGASSARARVGQMVAAGKQLHDSGQFLPGKAVLAEASVFYNKLENGDGCHFWAKFAKNEWCAHASAALLALRSFTSAQHDYLGAQLENVLNGGTHRVPLPASAAATGSTATSRRSTASASSSGASTVPASAAASAQVPVTPAVIPTADFSLSGLLYRTPVLIEGDRGSGKTHEARTLAKEEGVPLFEFAGLESTEAWELFGQYVQTGDGTLAWKDGKFAKAVRTAAKQKCIFLLDEMLRIPQRQLSFLLTALSKFDGEYRVSTGRIVNVVDGIGEEEVITCPAENLGVVATTNVGPEFAVDDLDPAVAERFVILRKDTTDESLSEALTSIIAQKGFSRSVLTKVLGFYSAAKELTNQGLLNKAPTVRTLTRAVELSNHESHIEEAILLQWLLWVERDVSGQPVMEQFNLIKQALNPA